MESIKITPPEGYEIDRDKSTFEEIIFKEIRAEYPKKIVFQWEIKFEYKLVLFGQLVQTSLEWNRIDGFENKCGNQKFCLYNYKNNIGIEVLTDTNNPIAFKDRKTAELFIETFRTELEQVKELL